MRRRRIIVRGAVQGVGYRWACRREAARLGVAGWVRNRPDGAVEIVVEGPDGAVAALTAWAHRGPSSAEVTDVETFDETPVGEHGFEVRG